MTTDWEGLLPAGSPVGQYTKILLLGQTPPIQTFISQILLWQYMHLRYGYIWMMAIISFIMVACVPLEQERLGEDDDMFSLVTEDIHGDELPLSQYLGNVLFLAVSNDDVCDDLESVKEVQSEYIDENIHTLFISPENSSETYSYDCIPERRSSIRVIGADDDGAINLLSMIGEPMEDVSVAYILRRDGTIYNSHILSEDKHDMKDDIEYLLYTPFG